MLHRLKYFCLAAFIPALLLCTNLSAQNAPLDKDSIALTALLDSMGRTLKTDSNCAICRELLNHFSDTKVSRTYPGLVSNAYRTMFNCKRRVGGAAQTLPLVAELTRVADQSGSNELKAWALYWRALTLSEINQTDSILPLYLQALELFEKTNSRDGLALT